MKSLQQFIILCLLAFGLVAPAQALNTTAPYAYVVDFETGAVLLSKEADTPMYPASMTKVMTAYLVMEQLASGKLSLDDTFPVSKNAWRMGGSRTFLDVNSQVRVEDLLRGLIIQSGNDAAVALAEGIAGSEEAFAVLMTEKAKELGMQNTTFTNASGWPDPKLITTVRDLAVLAVSLIRDFPQYYHIYSENEFTYNEIRQYSRNPILGRVEGADGLKTGYTREAGFGFIGSAQREGRRIIMVVGGFKKASERATESRRLVNKAFQEFANVTVFKKGDTIAELPVWLGATERLPIKADYDYTVTLPRAMANKVEARVDLPKHLTAPLEAGLPIGRVTLINDKAEEIQSFTVTAPESVAKVGVLSGLKRRFNLLLSGEL